MSPGTDTFPVPRQCTWSRIFEILIAFATALFFCANPAPAQTVNVATTVIAVGNAANQPTGKQGDTITVTVVGIPQAASFTTAATSIDLYLNGSLITTITPFDIAYKPVNQRVFTFTVPPGLAPNFVPVLYKVRVRAAAGNTLYSNVVDQLSPWSTANYFTVLPGTPPSIALNPSASVPGQVVSVSITGLNTSFVNGVTAVTIDGTGVVVSNVVVTSATSLTATFTIAGAAPLGARTVTVATGSEVATAVFSVVPRQENSLLICRVNAGVPSLIRAEGFTEQVGDLLVICTGGVAGQTRTVNLQLFLNTNVTSRIVSGDQTEALLIVDELAGPSSAVYQGVRAFNTETSLVWPNVTLVEPGEGQRVLRFTNVRANAAALGASAGFIPTSVAAFIAASPAQSLAFTNPQQVVAYVARGLAFDTRACNGSDAADEAARLFGCLGENNSGTRDLIGDTSGNIRFSVRFSEGFQSAFKPRIAENQIPSVPGNSYASESGFIRNTSDLPYAVGGATTGTRLMARFTNIPAGVRLFATTGPSFGSSSGIQAAFVGSGTPAISGVGQPSPVTPVPSSATLFCPVAGGAGLPAVELPVTNGTASAVWEITAADPGVNENAVFGIGVAYSPDLSTGTPGIGGASVAGSFAPAYAAGSGAERASNILPIPRFQENTSAVSAFRINSCSTTLLFPYVVSKSGFDTGLAIANTSQDPFANATERLQSGRCTLHFFGRDASGNKPASQQTDRAVAPGETVTMVLSSGGGLGLTGVTGFQGYVMAQCDFLYAHGFAFLTDGPIGSAQVAEGYLALVLDAAGSVRGSGLGEVRGH